MTERSASAPSVMLWVERRDRKMEGGVLTAGAHFHLELMLHFFQ